MAELMNEPPYIANIGDRNVRTAADAEHYIAEKYTTSYEKNGFGLYLMESLEDGAPLGICGLVKRPSLEHPDLGFACLQRYWSRGYTTEAARATLNHARDTLALPFVYGVVSPKNDRSIRLLEHLGLSYVRSLELGAPPIQSRLYGTKL
jgi:RimJ/RimL family protein N-acetyltransferase